MIDNQVAIAIQTLLYFTQLVSWVTHGFMQTNLKTNETNSKGKQEKIKSESKTSKQTSKQSM